MTDADARASRLYLDRRQTMTDGLIEHRIPGHMYEAILCHVLEGRPTGGFLTALLANDLMRAAQSADDANFHAIGPWLRFLYQCVPGAALGSYDAVQVWQHARGLLGIITRTPRA